MYSLSLYLKQCIQNHRHCRAAEKLKAKGETVITQLLLAWVTLNIRTDVFMNFFIHFMVMGRLAENIIFITLKTTESYEQSAGSMIDPFFRLSCVGKGVLLKIDNVSL